MAEGVVTWFNVAKGYGYIAPGDGTGAVFLPASGLAGLVPAPGQAVTYDVGMPRGFAEAVGPVVIR